MQTQIGAALKDLRQSKGLTQRTLSQRLDTSTPQTVSNYERGVQLPPLEAISFLAKNKKHARALVDIYASDVAERTKARALKQIKGMK